MSDPELNNEQRAETAMRALVALEFSTMCREDLECSIIDLIANLLHLAAQKSSLDPLYLLDIAKKHFQAEMAEEALNAVHQS